MYIREAYDSARSCCTADNYLFSNKKISYRNHTHAYVYMYMHDFNLKAKS